MPHPARWQRQIIFSLLTTVLLTSLPNATLAQPVLPTATELTASPAAIALSVPLGQSDTRTVTITNPSSQALTPALYEAFPAAPTNQINQNVAPELRAATLPAQSEQIDQQLRTDFLRAPDRQADFLIYLRDQADLSAAFRITSWQARGNYVYQTLRDYATQSQRGLRAALDARKLAYRPFWIVNAVLAHGQLSDAIGLASRSEVALVRANRAGRLPVPQDASPSSDGRCSPDNASEPVCWNIRQIGADRVWRDFGVTGRGVVVASIDTGVRYTHPALAKHYRGYVGPGAFDHNYNWFDPKAIYREPTDPNGHGTHTTGTMIASSDGTSDQPAVGVAPGAEWIAAQGCSGATCNEADLISSAQWMLAPTRLDGDLPRPDLRPMIVNNSWAGGGDDNWYAGYVAAWRAAGIFPVFAASNTGSACGSIGSPGDYANVLAVGATDQNDSIASFSARGPTADGRSKPDLVAPGAYSGANVGVLSTGISDSTPYVSLQGTSMATPHVSGLIALLWSANPALIGNYDATYALLRSTARGLGDDRCGDQIGIPNNVYGYGRIDAYAAIARARVDLPWLRLSAANSPIAPGASANISIAVDAAKVPGPGNYSARVLVFGADLTQPPATITIMLAVTPGAQPVTLSGRVVSAETGQPLAAQVGLRGGQTVATDRNGAYTLTLAAGSYLLVASAQSFLPSEQAIVISADLRLADIALQPNYPHITAALAPPPAQLAIGQSPAIGLTLGNSGTQPLYYSLRVLPDQFAMTRSDQAGGPAFDWIELPANARSLKLSDDGYAESVPLGMGFPFYNYTFTETLVTANGLLAFSPPSIQYTGITTGCFPDSSFFFYEIAPFRANLDPPSGGAIRFATIDQGATFVLSYEGVPLQGGPAGASYTFQVLLHNDGRIVYQYQSLADLPASLAVGLQRAPLDYQKLGCGKSAPLHDRLAIELQPQARASEWLRLSSTSGAVQPASQQPITVTLQWAASQTRLQRGQIEITSNDPLRSTLTYPISIDMLPAPHQGWLPFTPRSR